MAGECVWTSLFPWLHLCAELCIGCLTCLALRILRAHGGVWCAVPPERCNGVSSVWPCLLLPSCPHNMVTRAGVTILYALQELHDEQGRAYYYNGTTGASQWEKPADFHG